MSMSEPTPSYHLHIGEAIDVLGKMPEQSVNTVVTSPPYFGLRDYGVPGQVGMEATPDEYVSALVQVFREVGRVLRDDGTVWLNLGDSYAGGGGGNHSQSMKQTGHGQHLTNIRNQRTWLESTGLKPKDLVGIPWRVAFALQADGWYLRQDIIWHKTNAMPESVRDRATKAHEYIFLLSKSPRYYYDHGAVKEPAVSRHVAGNRTHKYADQYELEKEETQQHRTKAGLKALANTKWKTRNRRSVWSVATRPFRGAHFATFPPSLIEPCILAGCPEGGTVLDPFAGSGTVAGVALAHGRNAILVELNPKYAELVPERVSDIAGSRGTESEAISAD